MSNTSLRFPQGTLFPVLLTEDKRKRAKVPKRKVKVVIIEVQPFRAKLNFLRV